MSKPGPNYLEENKRSWDARAKAHSKSGYYNAEAFTKDPKYISEVVQFDVPRLPALEGRHVAHLMCHIGTDTLSLARLGAASVTGLDFSPAAVTEARAIVAANHGTGGEKVSYVEGNVFDAAELLGREKFDVVFTGMGVIAWIPKAAEWARVIATLLKPGGEFFMREIHPVLFTLEDKVDAENPVDRLNIVYPYFEQVEGFVADSSLSYADDSGAASQETPAKAPGSSSVRTTQFCHGLADIVQALIDAGLKITTLIEHDSVCYNALPGRMEYDRLSEYKIKESLAERVPLTFTIRAVKETRDK